MKKGLILFIHGIKGNDETWLNKENKKFFQEILLENHDINEYFDCDRYLYDSTFCYIKTVKYAINIANSLYGRKTKKNLGIDNIVNVLKDEIDYGKYKNYEKIVIIAHSMGGIISKKYILKGLNSKKVKLLFLLATPHQGSKKSLIPARVIGSAFAENLEALSPFLLDVNKEWLIRTELPKTYYFLGVNDIYVGESEGYNFENPDRIKGIDYEYISTTDDHMSISKPNEDSIVIKIAKEKLLNLIDEKKGGDEVSELLDENQYQNMEFVLKMIAADVLETTVYQSKWSFFHFETIFRSLSLKEQKKLSDFSKKIKDLYLTKYSEFQLSKINSSTELIMEIKNKLKEEDQTYYSFENKVIQHIHKFGLLHNLANEDEKIVWKKGDEV